MNAVQKSGRSLLVFHKGLIIVFAPLFIEIVLIVALVFLLVELDRESLIESRFRRCAAIGAKIIVYADQAAIDVIAWFRVASPELMKSYDQKMGRLKKSEAELMQLAKDTPEGGKEARDLVHSVDSLMQLLDQVASLAKERRIIEMAAVIPKIDNEFRASKNTHLEHVSSLTQAQQKAAEDSTLRQLRMRKQERQILLWGLAANTLLSCVLFVFFKKSISERLKVVSENTRLLSRQSPLNEPLSGTDEIALLDRAFHTMDRALQEAARRERALFDNASDVICVIDKDYCFQRINHASKRHWGIDATELTGKSILNLIDEKEAESCRHILSASMKETGESSFELVLKTRKHSALHTLWSSYWSEDDLLLYCVVHNISERKKLEQLKQSYLHMISSDLETPLLSIAAAAERLLGPLQSSLSEQARARVNIVKGNLGRLIALVADLLEMLKLSSGKLSLSKQDCRISDLIERSIQDLLGLAEKKHIELRSELSAVNCFVDANRIIQVIVNLGSNAIKFSPENSSVLFRAGRKEDSLVVEIIDSGRGVPENNKNLIFEKFKQVKAADGKRESGTGLGLPICKDIVLEHNGQIGVESEEGKGSTFWFSIPLSINESNAQAKHTEKPLTNEITLAKERKDPEANSQSNTPARQKSGKKASLLQKSFVLILIPLLIELVLVLSILGIIAKTQEIRQEELKQRQIATNAYAILDSYFKMIVLISGHSTEAAWYAYDECVTRMQNARAKMLKLLKGDPESMRKFMQSEKYSARLDPIIAQGRSLMAGPGQFNKKLVRAVQANRLELIAVTSGASKRLLSLIEEAERKESVNPLKQAALRRQQMGFLLAGLTINITSSFLLAAFFSKSITTRLAALADNTRRFSEGRSLNPPLPGNDEIAELDEQFQASSKKLAEARKRERAVFDNSQDLIAEIDRNYRFLSSNPAGKRLLLYEECQLVKLTLQDLVAQEDLERTASMLRSALGEESRTIESRAIRKDGSVVYLLWSFSRPSTEGNYYCTAHDISERKQMEQLKQEFLAVVSHDLRNPLSSVIGFITLIREGAMGKPGVAAVAELDEILWQAQKLLDLINDLLDLEKIEAGSLQLQTEKLLAGEVVYRAYEKQLESLPELELQLPENNSEIELKLDRDRMIQVFVNLIRDLKAHSCLKEKTCCIQVDIKQEADKVIWNVSAKEAVYDKYETETLFEKFQIEKKTGRRQEMEAGSPLALPLSRCIVEAHGGKLMLNTEKSSFILSIPIEPSSL